MTRVLEEHGGGAQLRRESASALGLDELVRGSVNHESRAPDSRTELDRRRRIELLGVPASKADEQGLGIRLEPPADAVLDLLRRMRLREHLRNEELDVTTPVAQPVMAILLCPALVRVELLLNGNSATCGACPPSSTASCPPTCSAKAAPCVRELIASFAPWITSTGQRTRRQSSCDSSGVKAGASCGRDHGLGVGLEPPAHAILDRLRRVRLREASAR